MLEVKVKGPAIKLQGVWKFKGETASVTEEEYLANEKYLELLKGKVSKENKAPEKPQTGNLEDEELKALREKAKEYGIKGAHSMKKENLIAKIAEIENEDNTDDEDTDENDEQLGEGQPQE